MRSFIKRASASFLALVTVAMVLVVPERALHAQGTLNFLTSIAGFNCGNQPVCLSPSQAAMALSPYINVNVPYNSNVAYVRTNGNDAIASIGGFPFASISNALAAFSGTGLSIWINLGQGTFNADFQSTNGFGNAGALLPLGGGAIIEGQGVNLTTIQGINMPTSTISVAAFFYGTITPGLTNNPATDQIVFANGVGACSANNINFTSEFDGIHVIGCTGTNLFYNVFASLNEDQFWFQGLAYTGQAQAVVIMNNCGGWQSNTNNSGAGRFIHIANAVELHVNGFFGYVSTTGGVGGVGISQGLIDIGGAGTLKNSPGPLYLDNITFNFTNTPTSAIQNLSTNGTLYEASTVRVVGGGSFTNIGPIVFQGTNGNLVVTNVLGQVEMAGISNGLVVWGSNLQ